MKQTPIHLTRDLLQDETFIKILERHQGPLALLTDDKVGSLYGEPFLNFLNKYELECLLITFPAGEKSKTRKTKEMIEDQLLAKKLGRDTLLIVMGGGVVTDLGGFVAATYLRGIPYLSIPTSLLAMVDASIGGKTGVNVKGGKNVIGAFYPPQEIFIDYSMLSTHRDQEILEGSAEILKSALIADHHFYEFLEEHVGEWKVREQGFLKKVISQTIKIKKKIIEKDSKEEGERRTLNFGHTIAHAVETLEEYQMTHGIAVALGMVVEALISHKLGHLSEKDFEAIHTLIKEMGFPLHLSNKITTSAMKEVMKSDKKASDQKPRFVILDGIGKTLSFKGAYCTQIEESILDEALGWMVREFSL